MTEKDVLYLLEKYASEQDEYFWQGFYDELEKQAGLREAAGYVVKGAKKLLGGGKNKAVRSGTINTSNVAAKKAPRVTSKAKGKKPLEQVYESGSVVRKPVIDPQTGKVVKPKYERTLP